MCKLWKTSRMRAMWPAATRWSYRGVYTCIALETIESHSKNWQNFDVFGKNRQNHRRIAATNDRYKRLTNDSYKTWKLSYTSKVFHCSWQLNYICVNWISWNEQVFNSKLTTLETAHSQLTNQDVSGFTSPSTSITARLLAAISPEITVCC